MKNLYPSGNIRIVWQCLNCPNEVRMSEVGGSIVRISIFVKKDDKEYCLHWHLDNGEKEAYECKFDISIVSDLGTIIFKSDNVPENLTPTTAYQKLLTYLIFL
jgi:hypothetical protein